MKYDVALIPTVAWHANRWTNCLLIQVVGGGILLNDAI